MKYSHIVQKNLTVKKDCRVKFPTSHQRINWDSVRLTRMPLGLMIQCENENFDREVMTLDEADIHIARELD